MRPRGTPEQLEARRRDAVRLVVEDGATQSEAAKKAKVNIRTLQRWLAAFQEDGSDALKARKATGRPPELSPAQLRKLERLLLKGPAKAGFDNDLWTCARVALVIERHFGVGYHPAHVSRILGKMGWTPQKPERRAIERDESAIEGWVKKEWPRILKKRGNARPP